jgi:hypothetical protein
MNKINEHIKIIKKNMTYIPDFLDTKSDLDLWYIINCCNDIIIELINDNFIDDISINKLSKEYIDINKYLKIITSPEKYFLIHVYLLNNIENSIKYCENQELYEACSNLKKLEKELNRDFYVF